MSKNKTAIAIALVLMFAMAISLVAIPTANAHDPPWTVETYAFINVSPNPVGAGQIAYINFWVDKPPPTSIAQWGYHWHNMTVTITKPNGDTETLKMGDSDAPGGTWTSYIPDQVGTYTFEGKFPTQTITYENPYPYGPMAGTEYINDTYTESSAKTTLTVQEQPIPGGIEANPLPTEYWTRPINSMNREWSVIGGNWLGLGAATFGNSGWYNSEVNNFNPYTTAPNSAHILWTKPEAFGGQIGGEFGSGDRSIYATGTAYETKFSPVILNGVLYYTQFPGAENNMGPLTAVDLRTGQTIWTKNASNPLRCGMIYNFKTGNQYGAHAYLFTGPASLGFIVGSTPNKWSMYDAMTGQWVLDIANVTAGTLVEGPNGEILSYVASGTSLTMFNMSKCIAAGQAKYTFSVLYSPQEIWRPPQGATIDWNGGYQLNVTIPAGLSLMRVSDNVALMMQLSPTVPGAASIGWRVDAGYSAIDGTKLWGPVNRTLTKWTTEQTQFFIASNGTYAIYNLQKRSWTGYDIKTGEQLWTTQPKNSSFGYYDYTSPSVIGYGKLYDWSFSGEVNAYDLNTGKTVWSWNAGSAGYNTPYGTWPLGNFPDGVLADGKLYFSTGHDYTPPVFKGAKMYCLNATTGDLIFSILDFEVAGATACADGVLVRYNGYDSQIYGYGAGPTKLTVTAPAVGVTTATPIVISGSITDISAGASQQAVAANFPNGLPCISDASQSQFMEAVYQQQPMPTNLTGVPITINVVDSNGNYRTIDTAVSNAYGTYSLTWKPDIPGDYTVIANFEGTNSYYASTAAAAFTASEPAATPALQPTQPASIADQYFIPMSATIIVLIIVVFAVLLLVLRKRQ
jgi:hypothetical protein